MANRRPVKARRVTHGIALHAPYDPRKHHGDDVQATVGVNPAIEPNIAKAKQGRCPWNEQQMQREVEV